MHNQTTDHKSLVIAVLLAALLLMGWQAFVEMPRRHQLARIEAKAVKERQAAQVRYAQQMAGSDKAGGAPVSLSRKEYLALSERVTFSTPKVEGSIALKGARFDDITLPQYRVELDPKSPPVTLFSPGGETPSYFAHAGWVSADKSTRVPDQNTQWQADKSHINANEPVTLRWHNGEGITFFITVTLDANYMFTITQRVENVSGQPVSLAPYAYINRTYEEDPSMQHYAILHEGPLGVMEGALDEVSYSDLREERKRYDNASGWFGITDKYWLSALVPGTGNFKVNFSHYSKDGSNRYQADYLADTITVESGRQRENSMRLFAGAKEIRVIDGYADGNSNQPPIPLFDRAVDFGSLYFLTKPMFLMLNFFYTHTGNFGIAILLLTIVVKLMMFPLANKSYKSAAQMRKLQPQMEKLRDRYGDDQIRMQQEMMAMYKREKVNPAAGCLPLLIQMPVFFALYKVLFVTIEMRHAPFFGWLKDLSAPDTSNLFTLFGLVEWGPPAWLHLGILPILFTLSMVIQMKQQPKPTDPVQAKIISWMPYFFLFIFAGFPAGLVLYWVWSNVLSILQQHYISKRYQLGKFAPPAKKDSVT